jgi:hypothetical protein
MKIIQALDSREKAQNSQKESRESRAWSSYLLTSIFYLPRSALLQAFSSILFLFASFCASLRHQKSGTTNTAKTKNASELKITKKEKRRAIEIVFELCYFKSRASLDTLANPEIFRRPLESAQSQCGTANPPEKTLRQRHSLQCLRLGRPSFYR